MHVLLVFLFTVIAADEPEDGIFSILQEEREVTVSLATRDERTIADSPAIISVMTRQQMDTWGFTTLADVLQNTPGFYVVDDFILPNLGVRGIAGGLFSESGNIKLMIDGHPASFRTTGGNWLGPELIPVSAIERIEIIRGPASALYGADAFLGVINVVTRDVAKHDSVDIRARTGVAGERFKYDLDGSLGGHSGRFQYLASARTYGDDLSGLTLPPSSPAARIPNYNAGATRTSGLDRRSNTGVLKLGYVVDDRNSLVAIGRGSLIDRGAEFSPWTTLAHGSDSLGRLSENRLSLYQWSGAITGKWSPLDKLDIKLDSVASSGGPTARERIEVDSPSFYVRRRFSFLSSDSALTVRWSIAKRLSSVTGVTFLWDRENIPSPLQLLKQDSDTLRTNDPVSTPAAQRAQDFINPGVFQQLVWDAIDKYLSLIGGVRYDYHNIYGSQLSGRLGMTSNPVKPLHLKLLYGGSFKAPSPLLLYAQPLTVGDVIGNASLKPQYVHTAEAEVSLTPVPYVSLSTDVSYNALLNVAQFSTQGINQTARNLAQIHAVTWETRVDAHYEDWVHAYLSADYTWTQRQSNEGGYLSQIIGTRTTGYPPFIFRAGVNGKIPRTPLGAMVRASFVAARSASDANTLLAGYAYTLPAYVMLDAAIRLVGMKLLGEGETTISAEGHNLLGSRGPDAGLSGADYPLYPREVLLQIRQQF